jgi:hypothetical protein
MPSVKSERSSFHAVAHDRLALRGKLEAGRELAQQLEQRQVRSCRRLEPM